MDCYSTCEVGYCVFGGNSSSCTKCNSLYFLQNSPNTSPCVAASSCGGSKKGVLNEDNANNTGNICFSTCLNNKGFRKIK